MPAAHIGSDERGAVHGPPPVGAPAPDEGAAEPDLAMVRPPPDPALPLLGELFDPRWVWPHFHQHFDYPAEPPPTLRPRSFNYEPGLRAVVSYTADWRWAEGLVEGDFSIELLSNGTMQLYRYPDDPGLPGLRAVADPLAAQDLVKRYAGIRPRRISVQQLRYRPGRRAILKHKLNWGRDANATLFVRVMQPSRVARFIEAGTLVAESGFVVPRLAGRWDEGGVVWMSEVPGSTLRHHVRRGRAAAPGLVLDALSPLWSVDAPAGTGRPLNLRGDYTYTRDVLEGLVADGEARETLERVTSVLDPFAEAWRPSVFAHNDFYDDQVIVVPDGRLAVVDFDEVGLGDPMVDVGNMLAHLAWDARFSHPAVAEYAAEFRAEALERFAWDPHELDLRVAYSVFRISPNPARAMVEGWPERVAQALELTAAALEGSV